MILVQMMLTLTRRSFIYSLIDDFSLKSINVSFSELQVSFTRKSDSVLTIRLVMMSSQL